MAYEANVFQVGLVAIDRFSDEFVIYVQELETPRAFVFGAQVTRKFWTRSITRQK